MESHAKDIGGHDPLVRVDIHFQKPVMRLLRADPGEEEEISKDHEPLDVVVVGGAFNLLDHAAQAVHVRLSAVEKSGQLARGSESVGLQVVWHFQPIDAVHEFPPADDLPHETFDGGERGVARFVGPLGRGDAFRRQEKAEIERCRNEAVKHCGRVLQHEILVIAEEWQAGLDKFPERLDCALARGR